MKSSHHSLRGVFLTALLASLVSTTAWAQAPTPPAWFDVAIIQVKGERGPDFEDRLKEIQSAARAKGLPVAQVFQVVSGHPNEYHLVTPMQSLAENDMPRPPLEPAAMASWFSRATATIDSVRFFYARTYPQHAIQGNQSGPAPQLLLLRTTHVISGKEAEYEAWVADQYMPAFRQTNPIGHTMSRGAFGDSGQNYYHAMPIANWAALEQGDPVARLLGERRMTQLIDGLDGIVESSGLVVARIREDLMGSEN